MPAKFAVIISGEIIMRLRIVGLALLFATVPATAFDTRTLGQWGSITLDELMPRLSKSKKLTMEIKRTLAESSKTEEQINCIGQRFPGTWQALGGERVAPY